MYSCNGLSIEVEKKGANKYVKVSYPQAYGIYTEISTPNYIFDLDLNEQIKYLRAKTPSWPHPQEWLKRTKGNDWVYYFSGGYTDIYDSMGEYYLPCLPYPTNTLWNRDPFSDKAVLDAIRAWQNLSSALEKMLQQEKFPRDLQERISRIKFNTPQELWKQTLNFFSILQGRVSVLPPECRHVDYDCIPVIVADGCLYNCRFCSVKSNMEFSSRTRRQIQTQIKNLRDFYSRDLNNYCALFLGMHDALNCRKELLEFSALEAYEQFEFEKSYLRDSSLFLFGSVDSFLAAREDLFCMLNKLPYWTYINLGLESADQATLDYLGKPVQADKVEEAFLRMLDINKKYKNIEVTCNFILDTGFSERHWELLLKLVRDSLPFHYNKGEVYLSPLNTSYKRAQIKKFKEIKKRSRLPTYLYLIQRL